MTKVNAFALAILLGSASMASAHVGGVAPADHKHHMTGSGVEQEEKLCDFAPKNDLRIPEGLENSGGIDRASFERAIDKVEALYTKIVAEKGAVLKMNRLWSSAEVNASATRKGKTWIVNAYGGLARFKWMTYDGEVMVLCHEMGHHLGGFPTYPGVLGGSWASNEGQSDYFATMKCFRRIIENDDNEAILSGMTIPGEVSKACQISYSNPKDVAICVRSSMTGQVLARVLYELGRSGSRSSEPTTPPEFNSPSSSEVATTNHAHPLSQCRLDTYFAGAICNASPLIEFSRTEGRTGACNQELGDAFGYRPRCWYRPEQDLAL
ncbi:MAG: hypothetical protein KGP28_04700 [Bdellovibrionales bacterium]|nr:hypothetical protein [Bdellovibrionales bacterium]